jgi:hypothetical protein
MNARPARRIEEAVATVQCASAPAADRGSPLLGDGLSDGHHAASLFGRAIGRQLGCAVALGPAPASPMTSVARRRPVCPGGAGKLGIDAISLVAGRPARRSRASASVQGSRQTPSVRTGPAPTANVRRLARAGGAAWAAMKLPPIAGSPLVAPRAALRAAAATASRPSDPPTAVATDCAVVALPLRLASRRPRSMPAAPRLPANSGPGANTMPPGRAPSNPPGDQTPVYQSARESRCSCQHTPRRS